MDDIPDYGAFIRGMDDICRQCIVCIRTYSDNGANLSVGTGIVIASGDRSCFVITSSALTKDKEVATAQFSDGAVCQIQWNFIRVSVEVSLIAIFDTTIHWEAVKFSNNEAVKGQRVFTYGYNSTPPIGRYISGNFVCVAGIKGGSQGKQFVHGCSTGKDGHTGSAVFNATHQLVGMNFSYTRCKGEDYYSIKDQQEQTETSGPGGKASGPGGLVSALDLWTIINRIQLVLPNSKGKSVQGTLEFLQTTLKSAEVMMGQ